MQPDSTPVTFDRNEIKHKTKSSLKWMAFSQYASIILSLITLTTLSRLLEIKTFGIVAIAMVVVRFSEMISTMGIGLAIVQLPKIEQRHINFMFLALLGTSIFYCTVLILASEWLAFFFRTPELSWVLPIIAIVIPIDCIAQFYLKFLERNLNFKIITILELTASLTYTLVAIILAITGYGIWAIVFAILLRSTTVLVSRFFASDIKVGWRTSWVTAKQVFSLSMGNSVAGILNQIARNIDTLIVGRLLGPEALGFYDRGYRLIEYLQTLAMKIFDRVMVATIARSTGDREFIKKIYLGLLSTIGILAFTASILLVAIGTPLIELLLGTRWSESGQVFQILVMFLVFRIIYKIAGTVLRGTSQIASLIRSQLIYSFSVAIGATIGAIFAGINGVAFGVGIGIAIQAFFMNFYVSRYLSIESKEIYTLLKFPFFLGFVLSIVLLLVNLTLTRLGIYGLGNVFINSAFFATTIVIFVFFTKPSNHNPILWEMLRRTRVSKIVGN